MKVVSKDEFKWGNKILFVDEKNLPSIKFSHMLNSLQKKNGKLLEVGTGSGRILSSIKYYYKDKFKYFGCDISSEGLKDNPHEVIQCDGLSLPYKNETFDVVVISDYLEHVSDFNKAIREIKRVLKKKGLFFANIPCEGEYTSLWYYSDVLLKLKIGDRTKDHKIKYRKKYVFSELQDQGFIIKNKIYTYHFLTHLLDFGLFTLTLIPSISRLFWSKNKYYNPNAKPTNMSRILNFCMDIANYISYYETKLLSNTSFFAKGVSVICIKKKK